MTKRILVIPARLNSVRIKNKNIKKFFGKPIIYYSIKAALKSKIFDEIHVSTENEKIKKIVEKYSVKVKFLRNKNLSNHKTKLIDVFKFVFSKYKKLNIIFDELWYLTPCSPMITSKDLINAKNFFNKKKSNSMLAISEYSPPIQWALKEKNHYLSPIKKKYFSLRSQDLKKTYFDTGTFGAFKKEIFLNNKKESFTGFKLSKFKGIDIDTMEDWILAKKIFKK